MKKILIIVLLLLIGGGALFGIINSQNKKIEELTPTKTLTASDYDIGIIDDNTGKFDENNYGLFTTGYMKVTDMEIKLEDDAPITYKVFFYDEDKALLSHTSYLNEDFDGTIAETAVYFRISVNTDETKVTSLNKSELLKTLSVSYTK